jgi:predicted Zn-dependent protease
MKARPRSRGNNLLSRWLVYFIAMLLVGCQTAPIEPMESADDAQKISEEERRIWHIAREFDKSLVEGGYLYNDNKLQNYVQGVMNSVYPEYKEAITVRIIDSPSLNAFALPHGSIYIHTGMLARLENEAQMATILAHEGVHFTHKHSWQQRRTIKQSKAFSVGFTIVTGIPQLGDLMAVSSIYGFSQDLEREADVEGFERLKAAGYDVTQAPVTFEYLLAEVKALDIKEPYFFSTHPSLVERINSFNELVGQYQGPKGYRNEEAYQDRVAKLKLELLNDYLEIGQYQSVILILEDETAFKRYPSIASFYLGEAYRLRGQEGDAELAVKAYKETIKQEPDFAPPYRVLGIYYMKQNKPSQAKAFFDKYLELSPDAPDRGYIESYRSSLKIERKR